MNYNVITAKEIADKLGVCLRTAKKYLKDIKEEFNLNKKPVTNEHFIRYLNLQ